MFGIFYQENDEPFLSPQQFVLSTDAVEWLKDRRGNWQEIEPTKSTDFAALVDNSTGVIVVVRQISIDRTDTPAEQKAALNKLHEAKQVAERERSLDRTTQIVMHPETEQEMAANLPFGYMKVKDDGVYIEWLKVVIDDAMVVGEIQIR